MNESVAVVLIVAFVVCVPFLVYLSVKLGTYAYFQGRELFEREKKDAEK